MDGAPQAARYGRKGEDAEARDHSAQADARRAVNALKLKGHSDAFYAAVLELERLQTRIYDMGGMDGLIKAQDLARIEMVRRRRKEIEAEGWIV